MSSPWSLNFKKRMMQLKIAVRNPETGEIQEPLLVGDIHQSLMDRMNNERMKQNLNPFDLDELYEHHRGYVHRETGKFMTAAEASEWACKFEKERWWSGESNNLRCKQNQIRSMNEELFGGD